MLENIKLLLGIDGSDRDDLLKLIISLTTSRLKILLGGIDPPEELDNIITEVSIIRFNRIGSEGMEDHTVEGEKQTFLDSDFAPYMNEIQTWTESQSETQEGGLRFL